MTSSLKRRFGAERVMPCGTCRTFFQSLIPPDRRPRIPGWRPGTTRTATSEGKISA